MRGSTAGLAEGVIVTRNTLHGAFLTFLDMSFASVIVGPAVIAYWQGTWNLSHLLFWPEEKLWNPIFFSIIGIIGHFVATYCQDWLTNTFHPDKHRLTFMVVSRLYTEVYGIIGINTFRGTWELMDIYCPSYVPTLIAFTVIGMLLLIACKGLRNISSSPFGITTDNSKDYFVVTTMFKTSATNEPVFYFVDCAFSVVVVGTLVILVWRSLWVLFDLLIFPGDPELSYWYSVAIGYGVVAITFALQPVMKWACDRLDGFWRIGVCDAFLFFSFIGTVNVWRGIWQLLDLLFLPDNKLLGNLITHGVSFVLLAMLNCSNSVLVRGVFIDAEEPAGQCVVFPVYYIRLFFQKERTKKQQRILDSLEKGELQTELLDKSEKTKPQIVKSSAKSIEMTAMANNRPKVVNGLEKEDYRNGEHKINQ